MRNLTPNEEIKIAVYEALNAPHVAVTRSGDQWEIDIIQEAPETYDSTDALMEAVKINLEETPTEVYQEAGQQLADQYHKMFDRFWIYNDYATTEEIDTDRMTPGEIEQEEKLRQTVDYIWNTCEEREREERINYGWLQNEPAEMLLRDF